MLPRRYDLNIRTPGFFRLVGNLLIGEQRLRTSPTPEQSWITLVYRWAGLSKKVQSLLVLGFSPMYLVGNITYDTVGRIQEGTMGYVSTASMDAYWNRLGVEPFFGRTAIGPAEVGAELGGLKSAGTTGAVDMAAKARALTGEIVGKAMTPEAGLLRSAEQFMDKANQYGPFTRATQWLEGMELHRAGYYGTRQHLDRNWKVGKGISNMPPDLAADLNGIDPRLGPTIDGLIESGLSRAEIMDKLFTNELVYNLDAHINETATAMDMDAGELKSLLSSNGVYDFLNERLPLAKTQTDKMQVLTDAQKVADDYLDARVRADLLTRAEAIANSVGAEGLAQGVKTYDDLQFYQSEHWQRHFAGWKDVYESTASVKGVVRSAIIEDYQSTTTRDWARTQAFEEATYVGMLKALGADDVNSQVFLDQLRGRHERWRDFFERSNAEKRKFFDGEFATPMERTNAWHNLQQRQAKRYMVTAALEAKSAGLMDQTLANLFGKAYGDDVVDLVLQWRLAQAKSHSDRTIMMRDHRTKINKLPGSEARKEWNRFIQNDYLAYIREYYTKQAEWMHDVHLAMQGESGAGVINRNTELLLPAVSNGQALLVVVIPLNLLRLPVTKTHFNPLRLSKCRSNTVQILSFGSNEAAGLATKGSYEHI